MHFLSGGHTSDLGEFRKIRSRSTRSDTTQSPLHGFLIVLPEIATLLKAHKRECVDTLIDAVHGQDHSIPDGRYTNEGRKISNRAQISSAVRMRMHQGRQWTHKLRTPTTLELEHLGLDDKTINGMILSSVLPRVRRGPLSESFGAKLHAACMTAMISGPIRKHVRSPERGGATRSRARRRYTSPFALFPNGRRKCAHPKEGPLDST
jgi:hypothetical protein